MTPHPAAEVLHMIADGHQGPWEYERNGWQKADSNRHALVLIANDLPVRLAPRTIKIGDAEVPAPESTRPAKGTVLWTIEGRYVQKVTWNGNIHEVELLKLNRLWLKQDHAQAAFDAITKLMGGEG